MGIPCGVLVAPVLPGLSDSEAQLTEVVEACAEAGAVSSPAWRCTCAARSGATTSTGSERTRPDLVRLHRERFRRGAYQEDDERQRIEGIVKVAARRCGVTGREPLPGRAADDRGAARGQTRRPTAAAGGRGDGQLRLL